MNPTRRPLAAALLGITCLSPLCAQAPDEAAYWQSVYGENRVVEIELSITRDAWAAMQPPMRAGRRPGPGGRGRGPGGQGRDGAGPGRGGPPGDGPRPGFGPPGEGGQRGGPPGGGGAADADEYTYVRAEISIDGHRFEDAGLRFKGNSSYRASQGSLKRPLKIDLDRFVDGQEFYGRTKLNLSNAHLDSAFMKEQLAAELYEAAGVVTAGVGWANVTLSIEGEADRQPLGVYVLVEQVDKGFLRRRLGKDSKGSLLMKPEVNDWSYLGDDPAAYEDYHIKSGGKDEVQFARFASLMQWIETATDEEFAAGVGDRLDLEQFAGYLAVTSALASIDSFVGMPHNYYLVLDEADGKLRILPWDLNESFGTFSMGMGVEDLARWDIDRPWTAQRRVLERLFATEAFPELYTSALEKLLANAFSTEALSARVRQFEEILAPFVPLDPNGAGLSGLELGVSGDASGYNTAVERRSLAILPFVEKRIASLRAQLAGEEAGVTLQGRRRR